MQKTLSLLGMVPIFSVLSGCFITPQAAPMPATQPVSVSTTPLKPGLSAPPQMVPMPTSQPAPTTLKFSPASVDAIEAGTKISTTRKGVRVFPNHIAIADDGKRKLKLDISSTQQKKFSELNPDDARADGSGSLEKMRMSTTRNYAGISADDVVTIITFRVMR